VTSQASTVEKLSHSFIHSSSKKSRSVEF